MRVICRGRQTGRTTELIRACAEAESRGELGYIVCSSHNEAYRISQEAMKMGLTIGFPLTYDEILAPKHGHAFRRLTYFVDNAEVLLQRILGDGHVEAVVIAAAREP